jgi:hypothetical protein
MVYFEDLGSTIEAPIEVVWEYLESEQHGDAHSARARNIKVREAAGPTSVVSGEHLDHGTWSPFCQRATEFPPLCTCIEELEGDFTGTRFVLLYRPEGEKTRVDVYGDVQSRVLDPKTALSQFLKRLESAYDDDLAGITEFLRKRSSK